MTVIPDGDERTLVSFDWAIKNLLRDKVNFDILEGFLSALLEEDMTVEEILESESNQVYEESRYNRVDLLVKDSNGRYVIVEIQNDRQAGFLQRLLFGTSKTIVEQIRSGEPYTQVKKIISVSIVYFPLGEGDDYLYHGKTEFLGRHTRKPLLISYEEQKALESSIVRENVFPEYHLICLDRFDNEVHEAVDEWIYMLKNSKIRKTFHSKHIQTAGRKLQLMHMSQAEQKAYLEYLGRKAEELDTLQTAHDDGMREGKIVGMREGIKEGVKEGKKKATQEIARKLLGVLSPEEIAEKTGLSIQEIQDLL